MFHFIPLDLPLSLFSSSLSVFIICTWWQVIKASLRQQPSRRSYPILSWQHTHTYTFILRSNINRNHMILVVSWHRLDISIQVTFHSGDTFRLEVSIRRVYLEKSWVAPGPEDGTRTVMLSSASESIEVVVCDSRISLYIKVSRTVLCCSVHALQKSVEVVVSTSMRCTSGGWRFTCCSWTLPCTRYVGQLLPRWLATLKSPTLLVKVRMRLSLCRWLFA